MKKQKFKKIEISAFRAYLQVEDGTFDFSCKNGKVANFVSLYAPNGFGKTSFYDAVEWAVTNKNNRFLTKEKENKQMSKAQSSDKRTIIIRNNDAPDTLETYVKVTFDDGISIKNPYKIHGSSNDDLNQNKTSDNTDCKDFTKVLLSQEWISGFLIEDEGKDRYGKFKKESPELEEMDQYFQNILALEAESKDKKDGLNNEISQLQVKTDDSIENNLIDIINQFTSQLNIDFELNLHLTEENISEEDVFKFQNTITDLINENKIERLRSSLSDIEIAKSGNEDYLSLKNYFELKEKNKTVNLQIDNNNALLKDFEQLEIKTQKKENLTHDIQKKVDNLNDTKEINELFDEYQSIIKSISEKDSKIKDAKTELKNENDKVAKTQLEESDLKAELNQANTQLSTFEIKKRRIPEIEKILTSNDVKKQEEKRKINNGKIEKNEKEISQFQSRINLYKKTLEKLDKELLPSKDELENKTEIELLDKLKKTHRTIAFEQTKISTIEENLKEIETLNSDLAEFIKKGIELINQTQSSACPLCEQNYNSYEVLSTKVTNNKSLNTQLKALLEQKNQHEQTLSDLKKSKQNISATLHTAIKSKIDTANTNIEELRNQNNLLNAEIKIINIELEKLEQKLNKAKQELDDRSLEQYKLDLNKEIENTQSRIRDIRVGIENKAKELASIQKTIEKRNDEIEIINSEKTKLKNDLTFTKTTHWFKNTLNLETFEKTDLDKHLTDLTDHLTQMKEDLNKIDVEIKDLIEKTQSHSKNRLKLNNEELSKEIEAVTKTLNKYATFLAVSLSLENTELDNEVQLNKTLSFLKEETTKKHKLEEKKIEAINKLEGHYKNLIPFLESKQAKTKIDSLNKEIDFILNKIDTRLNEEKQKVKGLIESKVNSFFHLDLINSLYRKIDPHPFFKEVGFKVNFNADTPRLDVFVTSYDGKPDKIPNLYFSTAQINVLSLSIFLASALHSEKYDSIFIDDPVQSMDSINVLSTIDLMRSLAFQYDKQIILSTHDENFHKLLKKKMPSDLFDSKFLRLETFGKVIVDTST